MNAHDPILDDEGTVFRDVLMLTLLGFVTIVVLMLPHLHPPKAATAMRPPGNVVVEARWADGLASDVDLWVEGPGDGPVGYSRKSGTVFDLLRDDLGASHDLTRMNYEFAFSRGAPAGPYTVNLHLYNLKGEALPIGVDVVVSVRDARSGKMSEIASRHVELTRQGEEMTVVRFRLDGHGRLIPRSVNALPKMLRGTSPAERP